MAEEAAEEEQRLKQATSRLSNGSSSKGGRTKLRMSPSRGEGSSKTSHAPPSIQQPVVSFADIVSSQQQEMEHKG